MELGPSILKECDDCKNRKSDVDRLNQTRLVIIDCRIDMLQKEAMLPRTAKFEVTNNCDKK